jgi:hypothetical protein
MPMCLHPAIFTAKKSFQDNDIPYTDKEKVLIRLCCVSTESSDESFFWTDPIKIMARIMDTD